MCDLISYKTIHSCFSYCILISFTIQEVWYDINTKCVRLYKFVARKSATKLPHFNKLD
jgi:hypothetical protein